MRLGVTQQSGEQWGMQDAQVCWERIRQKLPSEVGEKAFDRFLRPVALVGAERGRVRLGAASRFLRNFLISNFSEPLHRLWRAERAEIVAVEIVTWDVPQNQDTAAPQPRAEVVESAQGVPRLQPLPSSSQRPNASGLVSSYRFENFVVGPSNALAHEAARRVVEDPGARFNPLFIYGPSGAGKTHLMHATGNAILATRPQARVRYLSAERFVYLFISALREKNPFAFKEEFRTVDVLLVDDFHYIGGNGRETTHNEFLHTLNALIADNKQIVISADNPPGMLQGFDESMRARLGRGFAVDVTEMDVALRLGVLNKLREQHEVKQKELNRCAVEFAPDVLPFLAERLSANGHELSGAFNRISGQAEFEKTPVTIEFAQRTLKEVIKGSNRPLTIEEILQTVSTYTGIKVQDMKGAKRTQHIVRARHMAWWLCRELTERSYPQIAQKFGGRDHTSCIHGFRRIEETRQQDPKLQAEIDDVIKILKR